MVPAFLAVSAVGVPACNGGDKTTMTTEGSGESTVATMTPTEAPTGTVTDTDGVPDCKVHTDQAACMAVDDCLWFVEAEQCIVECETITDQATCQMQDYCEWYNNQCSMLLA